MSVVASVFEKIPADTFSKPSRGSGVIFDMCLRNGMISCL